MPEADPLTLEFFAAHLGEVLEIALEDREPYRLEITDARAMGGESDAREPFSVLFRAHREGEELVLPQRIYRLEHDRMGPLELFLVPLGPEKEGAGRLLYEAAFS